MRLDKLLAHARGLTRSAAQIAIRRGEVRVDGTGVRDPSLRLTGREQLLFRGEPLGEPQARYYMLHKPAGYLSATEDGQHPIVLDLLPDRLRAGLHTAGRLDLDTTGLLLITDDGAWSHRVTAPRHKCEKSYRVTLADPLPPAAEAQLRAGVMLRGDPHPTLPAVVERIDERSLRLTIVEGRYHQVKRMLAAVGNHVTALHRERIGPIQLDATLAPGQWRPLLPEEIAAFSGARPTHP